MKVTFALNIISCLVACALSAPQWPGIGSSGYGFAPWGGYGNYASSSASAAASSSSSSFNGFGAPGYGYGWPGYGQGFGNYRGGYQQQHQQFNHFQYNGHSSNGYGNGYRYPFGYGK